MILSVLRTSFSWYQSQIHNWINGLTCSLYNGLEHGVLASFDKPPVNIEQQVAAVWVICQTN